MTRVNECATIVLEKGWFWVKKNKNLEMRIYELFGIKWFKKFVFFQREIFCHLLMPKKTKEEVRDYLNKNTGNYKLGKVKSLDDLKTFKKWLYVNATIHSIAEVILLLTLGVPSIALNSVFLVTSIVNVYCILLQRYNCIRINQVIEHMKPKYEKQKEEVKKEIIKEDSLIKEHQYNIVNNKNKKEVISLDEFLSNASLIDLKNLREHLTHYYKSYGLNSDADYAPCVSMNLKRNKRLKLEFIPKK